MAAPESTSDRMAKRTHAQRIRACRTGGTYAAPTNTDHSHTHPPPQTPPKKPPTITTLIHFPFATTTVRQRSDPELPLLRRRDPRRRPAERDTHPHSCTTGRTSRRVELVARHRRRHTRFQRECRSGMHLRVRRDGGALGWGGGWIRGDDWLRGNSF